MTRRIGAALLAAAAAAWGAAASPVDASLFTLRPPDARALDAATFGAVGDGVADDTLPLQRALNATYGAGLPDCTLPGVRVVYLEGNGKRYRVTSSLLLYTYTRLVGWGATRPALVLAAAAPGFANASALAPLLRAIDGVPDGSKPCTVSTTDGGNTAFGSGVMNVDVAVGAGNAGAVGVRWRAAQGGLLRAMRFDLAADAAAAVHAPGWAHEDLHFVGGRVGVLVLATGAWPSVFRDCVFEAQAAAGIAWDAASYSPWEGVTVVRGAFSASPAAADATLARAGRLALVDCTFEDLGVVVAPPAFAGNNNSSVLVRGGGGARVPLLMGASDAGGAVASPGGATGAFAIGDIVGGAQTDDARAPGGGVPRVRVRAAAAPAAAPPPMPPRDTFAWPPVAEWVSVVDHGVVGDGATDNAAALNALVAASALGATLFFPVGVYVVGATVHIDKRVSLVGFSVADVVLTLPDGARGFADPAHLVPIVNVSARAAGAWIVGMNVRSGFTWGLPAPSPAPASARNPNPGALAVQWDAPSGGVQDAFFHPATWPDNPRVAPSPQTELTLVITGGGTFSDLWSSNAYSLGGVRVVDARGPVTFYQLSSEHHAGSELLVDNSTVAVRTMQTEDRSPDAAPTASVVLRNGARADIVGLYSYYAANVSSAAAVDVDAGCACRLAVFRQWHSYHPMFYNCSLLARCASGNDVCVNATDLAFVGVVP
jgi:hypothetical protein